jgi:dihydroorotase
VLHLTTAKEMEHFTTAHRSEKRITAEVCVHHLWFDESNYEEFGTKIKCNPAIKRSADRQALIKAVNDGRIDIIATDHAPHTWDEKQNSYFKAPAGLPLVQHALLSLFEQARNGDFALETVVDRSSHAVADIFGVVDRGYVREGYFADLVLIDENRPYKVTRDNVLYKCGWSPYEGQQFSSTIDTTIINGEVVYANGRLTGKIAGRRLAFQQF